MSWAANGIVDSSYRMDSIAAFLKPFLVGFPPLGYTGEGQASVLFGSFNGPVGLTPDRGKGGPGRHPDSKECCFKLWRKGLRRSVRSKTTSHNPVYEQTIK